jgi:hypothetical protein
VVMVKGSVVNVDQRTGLEGTGNMDGEEGFGVRSNFIDLVWL